MSSENGPAEWQKNTEAIQDALTDPSYTAEQTEELAKAAYADVGEYQKSEEFQSLVTEAEVAATTRDTMQRLKEMALAKGQELHQMLASPEFVDQVLSGETAGMDYSDRVMLLGITAMAARPEDTYYQHETIVNRNSETDAERTWRKSINSLRSFAHDEPSTSRFSDAQDDVVATQRLNERARAAAQARMWLRNLERDADVEHPTEDFEEGIQRKVERSRAIDLAEFFQLPISFLGMDILPREEGLRPEGRPRNVGLRLEAILTEYDPERLAVLQSLADKFGDREPRLYQTGKVTESGELHRANMLVLTFDIDDQHRLAIIERPAGHLENNKSAAFVIDERKAAGTWPEMAPLTRTEIRQLGAERIVHAGDWKEELADTVETALV